jgi:hypothetical protein
MGLGEGPIHYWIDVASFISAWLGLEAYLLLHIIIKAKTRRIENSYQRTATILERILIVDDDADLTITFKAVAIAITNSHINQFICHIIFNYSQKPKTVT